MCGIVGIVSRPPSRPAPTADEIIGGLETALARCGDPGAVTAAARVVDAALHGLPGVLALADRHDVVAAITARLDQLDAYAADVDAALAVAAPGLDLDHLEAASAASIELRDVLWAIRRDRLRTAHEVATLAGRDAGPAALSGYLAIQQALSAIDRMEVRGRDSAGLHVFVWDHDLDGADPKVTTALTTRAADPLFVNRSARLVGNRLSIVYKAAAEIGELGDNTRALRKAVSADGLLRLALVPGPAVGSRPHPLGQRGHHL
jgi:glutamine---fructose-6-phosphate transaminase (isomerizing)